MMEILAYPSKGFRRAWRKTIDDKIDFRVDAKIGDLKKKHVKRTIDILSIDIRQALRSGYLSLIFGGDLATCVLSALGAAYHVEYSELDKCLVVTFRKKKNTSS